jgi:hypothetical protein
MSSITTRAGKGSPLTYTEVDSNFTNLNSDKIQASNGMGSSGQVLTTDGTNATWTTPSSGGNSLSGTVLLASSSGTLVLPATLGAVSTNSWSILSSGGISGVSVNATNKTFTLPAGSYYMRLPSCVTTSATYQDVSFEDTTDGSLSSTWSPYQVTFNSGTKGFYPEYQTNMVLTGSKTFRFTRSNSGSGSYTLAGYGSGLAFNIILYKYA